MAPYNNDNREVTYEIVEEIGVLSESSTGWKKELNVVSWNGGQAKYDIREWSPNHTQMSKGLTLNEREMRSRRRHAEEEGIPMTNYGIAIAKMHGILKRAILPLQ